MTNLVSAALGLVIVAATFLKNRVVANRIQIACGIALFGVSAVALVTGSK